MLELIMVKIQHINSNYFNNAHLSKPRELNFQGSVPLKEISKKANVLIQRPVACENTTGLLSFKQVFAPIQNYFKSYKENLSHTYQHKIIFAKIEKELYGHNSIDSITHDLDKLVLYILGLPHSLVSACHKKISEHHIESGKKLNLRSLIVDNIASSPQFKPEKTKSLREHFYSSKELQSVIGLKETLEAFNFGEKLDFDKIKSEPLSKVFFVA